MHNARKENLMNNKKKYAFLSLAIAMGMILGACTPAAPKDPSSSAGPEVSSSADESSESSNSSEESSSSSSSSSEEQVTLVSIAVTAPTKVSYTTADTALDLTGMVVTATYSDRSTQVITSGYTVSTVNFSSTGEKTVTVTYEGKTDSFRITVANQKFTVKFVVNGVEVQTGLVEDGQLAVYSGQTPTKAGDTQAPKYRFIGWDRDLTQPITANTTFTAQFQAYASEIVVDDFESYSETGLMKEAGWAAYGYSDGGWTTNTNASVSLATNSVEGSKALRFDAWNNNTTYMFAKTFEANQRYDKAANAFRFRMMVPSIDQVRIIMYADSVTVAGQTMTPWFKYVLNPTSSEYVEYTIPVTDNGWRTFGKSEEGQSMAEVAEWAGIHPDDIVDHISKIEFYVQGNDGIGGQKYIAFMDSVKFVTLDNPQKAEVETMKQYSRYTGLLNDGHTVRIDLGANNTATATVLDAAEQQQQIPGTVAIDADKNMTFTSADSGATLVYKAALKNGGQSMKFVSANGAYAQAVANVDLNAVQVVDNYEQYESAGQAYYQGHAADQRSGCRGAYYSEYYAGSGSSPWGGDKWSLLGGSGDQLDLVKDQAGAHSGNNYLKLKHTKSSAFRYMQWGLFDGSAEKNAFRGSKFSFWAKSERLVKAFKVSMYSQTKPTLSTADNQVKTQTFTQTEAIGEWKHFEIDLNPALTYYGFMISIEKNTDLPDSANTSYLYIDDVEVYTANPYAKYEAPKAVELLQGATYSAKIGGGLVNARLDVLANKAVKLSAPGFGVNVEGTYTSSEEDVTMTLGTDTYVATVSEDLKTLTFKSVSGTGMVAQFLNNVSFAATPFAENAETYLEDGKMYYQGNKDKSARSGARGAFYCEYEGGSSSDKSEVGGTKWILMGGNGDQLQLDKSAHQEGAQSLKMKYSSGGAMRYMQWELYEGTAKAKTGYNRFGFWVKNASSNSTTINVSVYKASKVYTENVGDNNKRAMTGQFTLAAGTDWTFKTIELDPNANYYGFAVWFAKHGSSSGFVNFDNAYFFNTYESHELNFFTAKDLTLNGTTGIGAASIKFDVGGKAYFTCADAGLNNVECSYTSAMNGANQEMTVTVGNNVIKGVYAVDATGKATFTVSEVTGDYAAAIPANTVFSNK